ncbi:MAG: YidC/Oxa1 family membrane protein insertase [Treponema sp.]|jgi:YidC/Oxa1 family membrane protein insertase|nr:YidC/Oxa1 family membrane protein insertase [Treponema sp.]
MITDFLYNLVIFPVIQIIELIYVFTYRLFGNHGLAILGVSVAISAFTLPLYFAAEKWQKKEREIQKKLKPGMQKIKAVFRGDEQYMILAAYYRQNHYHPVYAMRSTFGILVQVPFFIAAYSFLTHLEILKSTPFFFIRDLGNPDGLLSIKGYSINILPVVMTCLNIASGVIYTKGFNLKDKLQLYGMAVVFLILLYNSPSGLVLYWTISNGFSLAKNIVVKLKKPKYFLYRASCLFVVIIDVFLLFFHGGYIVKRIFAAAVFSLIFFLPIFKTLFFKITAKISGESGRNALYRREIFVFSALNLFLLIGAVTPSLLIASSTQEFSYIEPYTSPFPFILATLNQALGLFVFWPFCLYALFSPKVKTMFSHAAGLLFVLFSVNTFLFPGDYGFISTTLVLSNPGTFFTNYLFSIINAVCLIAAVILFSRLFVSRFKKAILSFQIIVFTAFLGMTIFNFMKTEIEFNTLKQNNAYTSPSANSELFKPVFNFSQKEKNIMIIMLDRAISAYIPQIFTEKPELSNSFDGFVWYPNNVSFGKFTIFGAPPLFGGYEYTPFEIQKRNSETLLDKYNESLLVLPGIFSKNNFIVTVTDPPWANFSWKPDLTIFKSINNGGGGG